MKIKSLYSTLILLTHALYVQCTEVTFRAMAVNGVPSVIVDGKEVPLELHEYPVYKAKVDVSAIPVQYKYAITNADGTREEEQFMRTFEGKDGKTKTLNEFFGRQVTVVEHPALPRAYNKFEQANLSNLYDDSHVATIIIKCDQNMLNGLYANTHTDEKLRGVEVTYASPYSVRTFTNATLGLSGQSTIDAAKLSYKISDLKTDDNKELFKRTSIKLRAEHMDPSFLRDKIYGDVLNSLGVPTAQNKLARVYINGQGIGLFDISDNIANKRYLRETLNKGVKYEQENAIFKADYYPEGKAWGDLGYYGEDPTNPMYSIYMYKGGDANDENEGELSPLKLQEHLIPLLKEINDYPTTGTISLDVESFLKFMAMEYAAGAVDNFWLKPGNYFIFKDVAQNKWQFLDADFHFSLGAVHSVMELLNSSMENYVAINQEIPTARPMLDIIMATHKEFFVGVLKRMLETSFNINILSQRIDSFVALIDEDARWDFSLPRVSAMAQAENIGYTYDDFVYHVTCADDSTVREGNVLPLKYWISKRGQNIATELGIPYPAQVDFSLGTVESPSQAKSEENGAASIMKSMNLWINCIVMILFATFIF